MTGLQWIRSICIAALSCVAAAAYAQDPNPKIPQTTVPTMWVGDPLSYGQYGGPWYVFFGFTNNTPYVINYLEVLGRWQPAGNGQYDLLLGGEFLSLGEGGATTQFADVLEVPGESGWEFNEDDYGIENGWYGPLIFLQNYYKPSYSDLFFGGHEFGYVEPGAVIRSTPGPEAALVPAVAGFVGLCRRRRSRQKVRR